MIIRLNFRPIVGILTEPIENGLEIVHHKMLRPYKLQGINKNNKLTQFNFPGREQKECLVNNLKQNL